MVNNSPNNLYDFQNDALVAQSILDVFVLQDILDYDDAEKLKKHFKTNREIENFLVKNHIVAKDTINKAYSIMLKLPYVELKNVEIPEMLKKILPEKIVYKYGIVPFSLEDDLIRIALSRPSDLLASYQTGLEKIFEEKKLEVELFVTGESDFKEALKQYKGQNSNQLLIKKGSLPVVYLRNQFIPTTYYQKLPRSFVSKYRIVVFGQNKKGYYLIACEQPDSPLTIKILDFLSKENGIKIEKFATSKDDIDAVLELWDRSGKKEKIKDVSAGSQKNATILPKIEKTERPEKGSLAAILDSFLSSGGPEITIDKMPDEIMGGSNTASGVTDEVADNQIDEKRKAVQPQTVSSSSSPAAERRAEKTESGPSESRALKSDGEVVDKIENENIGGLIEKDITSSKDLAEVAKTEFVPQIVAAIINFAVNQRSSDVHIEPEAKILRIRARIDGILQDVLRLSLKLHPPIISRIKILSRLKIDESRIPQDGRFEVVFKNREVDVRVSTLPTVHGEKVVMRILDKTQGILSLEDLGMQGSAFDKTVKSITDPFGIILSTGPTGSGKSTTLYAILNRISSPQVNIVTLEDPVEYDVPGINQCQIKPEIGFTFASGLRSILRQDPNIIMVGEIRDAETANMATHAALTGHLVLSTLHTNDTSGALPRLINMGIEPFLITSSIDLIIAQRLVRRICLKCKEEMRVPQKLMDNLKAEINKISPKNTRDHSLLPKDLKLYYGKGCSECNRGYKGRVGLFEAMTIDPEIEELAIAKRSANEIQEISIKNGMITMKQEGIIKAFQGITTIDEVFQAVINN